MLFTGWILEIRRFTRNNPVGYKAASARLAGFGKMTRFHIAAILGAIAFFCIGFFLSGWTRIWAFTVFWTVFLSLVGCGVAFIQLAFFGPVICRGRSSFVALTFDDGPDPVSTPALLQLLKQENIQAAFFCIGKNADTHPELLRQIIDDGHLIGNHTYNHAWWTPLLGRRGLMRELARTQQTIFAATGATPIFIRPPVGLTNPHYRWALQQLGLQMVGWDVRSMDTRWPTDDVIQRVVRKTRPGSIILLHDANTSAQRLTDIVLQIITDLRRQGFVFARLDRLMNAEQQ